MPVGSLEEVDEVDAEGVFGLAQLPILAAAAALELFAESAYLVGQGSSEAGRVRNRGTHRAQYDAALALTSWALRMNSPNCGSDDSNSRMAHLGPTARNECATGTPWNHGHARDVQRALRFTVCWFPVAWLQHLSTAGDAETHQLAPSSYQLAPVHMPLEPILG